MATGPVAVLQQTPLAVTDAPPSAVTVPPAEAVVAVIELIVAVVIVGKVVCGFAGDGLLSFLQLNKTAAKKGTNKNAFINQIY